MNLESFGKLEYKINQLIQKVKGLSEENARLKADLDAIRQERGELGQERDEVRSKVSALLELLDGVEL